MILLLLGIFMLMPAAGLAQEGAATDRLAWFRQAKLGIFVHWGIYAVDGIDESWSFYNGDVTYDEYMDQLKGFTAADYDPRSWAELFRRSGARYSVLTTRHHDGVALWDSDYGDLSVVQATPAGCDLVGPYVEALREAGLRVGLYYSHSDWSHPDYASLLPPGGLPPEQRNQFSHPLGGEDPTAWARYLQYHRGQIEELLTRYRPDLLWFDGDWERTAEQWDMAELKEMVLHLQPAVIMNSRMSGYGDYDTPEQGLPIVHPPGMWELCLTTNESWGYQPRDQDYKSIHEVISTFTETLGMGGNLLLNIGPKADGTIPAREVEILDALGRWIAKHEEAVYRTNVGLPPGHFYGPSSLADDSTTLYLYLQYTPTGQVFLKGIRNQILRALVVGTSTELEHSVSGGAPWNNIPGLLRIAVPNSALDEYVTVLRLDLDGPLDLYRGAGGALQSSN